MTISDADIKEKSKAKALIWSLKKKKKKSNSISYQKLIEIITAKKDYDDDDAKEKYTVVRRDYGGKRARMRILKWF